MKLPLRQPKKTKLQASTARRVREADFTEEPNVKLSSAFVVVLILHIVAVGGIYLFNAIKAHQFAAADETVMQQPQTAPQVQPAAPIAATTTTQADAPPTPAANTPAVPEYYRVKSGDTIMRIATAYGVSAEALINLNHLEDLGGIHVGQELKLPSGATMPSEAALTPRSLLVRDSGNYYTVKSGDTPVSIAHKLHVVYADLIQLNKIEDPKRLKIGSRLKVPMRRSTIVASAQT
jgi:LysM repeat protein